MIDARGKKNKGAANRRGFPQTLRAIVVPANILRLLDWSGRFIKLKKGAVLASETAPFFVRGLPPTWARRDLQTPGIAQMKIPSCPSVVEVPETTN